jgi:hypothetical protein
MSEFKNRRDFCRDVSVAVIVALGTRSATFGSDQVDTVGFGDGNCKKSEVGKALGQPSDGDLEKGDFGSYRKWALASLTAGDCTLSNITVVVKKTGEGTFSAKLKSASSIFGDIWHNRIVLHYKGDDAEGAKPDVFDGDSEKVKGGELKDFSYNFKVSPAHYDLFTNECEIQGCA